MIRLLTFFLVVLALGFGFAWLADRPGELSLLWEGQLIEMSLAVAASIVVAIVAAVMICWWLVRTIWTSPHSMRRFFRARKRDRGYQALSTGLIAAGAGNAALAKRMSSRARGLLRADQEPLILMLEAQAALIEGRQEDARRMYERMAEDPETRELGLRGLYIEASRLGANEAARQYAERAVEHAPYLPWAAKATLENKSRRGEWDDAIRLLEQQRLAHVMNKAEAERLKAVLKTAKAKDALDGDPALARDMAVQALKHAKDFVPAALIAAQGYRREENVRKASAVLEQVWKRNPHPHIAELYVRLRNGDSAADRVKRAEKLESLKPNNPDALFTVAEAALAARDFKRAREKAESLLRMSPSERVFLLLADIEEAETGDQGRIRHWMANALRAPRNASWVADGYTSDTWLPISPVTGRLDAFEWKVPFDQLAGPTEDASRAGETALASLPPLAERVPENVPAAAPSTPAEQTPPASPASAPPEMTTVEIIPPAVEKPAEKKAEPAPVAKPEVVPIPMAPAPKAEKATPAEKPEEPLFGRLPDDPGVRDPAKQSVDKTRVPIH